MVARKVSTMESIEQLYPQFRNSTPERATRMRSQMPMYPFSAARNTRKTTEFRKSLSYRLDSIGGPAKNMKCDASFSEVCALHDQICFCTQTKNHTRKGFTVVCFIIHFFCMNG